MITEEEVQHAIKECLREPVTGSKRSALADLIIIEDYFFGKPMPTNSFSAPPEKQAEIIVETNGSSEFLKAVDGRKAESAWILVDELVEAVRILHPRMYSSFLDKLQDL